MKTISPINKSNICLAILSIILLSCNLYSQDQNYLKVKKALDDVRSEYEKNISRKIPSLNVLIQTPADYIFVSSVPAGNEPITKDTYFRFASNTKNFTSTSILKMQQDGWLDIKSKITDVIPGSITPYIPDTPEFDIPYKNEITIEQLLQHSAGVYDVDNDSVPGYNGLSYVDYMMYKDPAHQYELSELVNQDAVHKLYFFPPGKGYHYSNTGFTMLSEIIERVYSFKSGAKKYYADYVRDHITGSTAPVPLDITFPYLASDVKLPVPYATGLMLSKDTNVIFTDVNMSAHVGEGNGIATMSELNKYIRTLMKGENALNKQNIELMQHSVSDSNKTYGLGCFYIKDLGYGHNGCIKGYLSLMLYDPETDVSVIVMLPENDYTIPNDEESIIKGLKAIVNAGFAARIALGFSGKLIDY
ncbi:MAG TPA: serine hydrolase domain-containing protein [Ignavibacteria bacterium]|nr:serine hydrolase domain-containing protein [Ignavibacteria bacterium]